MEGKRLRLLPPFGMRELRAAPKESDELELLVSLARRVDFFGLRGPWSAGCVLPSRLPLLAEGARHLVVNVAWLESESESSLSSETGATS